MSVPGLRHAAQLLTADECAYYLKWINSPKRIWGENTSKYEDRRVQHYGSWNGHTTAEFDRDAEVNQQIPDVLTELYNITQFRLNWSSKFQKDFKSSTTDNCNSKTPDLNVPSTQVDIAQIYSYASGQGIHQHFDSLTAFQEEIVMITIAGTCEMTFDLPQANVTSLADVHQGVFLRPGSVVVLRGDSRFKWRHGIPKRVYDRDQNGLVIERIGNRVSIVFRQRATHKK